MIQYSNYDDSSRRNLKYRSIHHHTDIATGKIRKNS